jgi:putative sigma-54 modulation protein
MLLGSCATEVRKLELSITSRRAEMTDSMKEYAEEKVRKLDRYYDRITSTDVIVDQESTEQHRVEIVVRADHKHTFVAHVDAGDFYEAVDLVIDKIGRQLSTHKDKVRNHKKNQ